MSIQTVPRECRTNQRKEAFFMAMSDEVHSAPRYKQTKKKKSFAESFIPLKGDSSKVVANKVMVLFFVLVIIICVAILGVYFYHIFEAKQNHSDIKDKYNQIGQRNSAGVSDPVVIFPEEEGGEIVRSPLVNLPFADEMLEINPDYVGYVSIPGRVNEAVVQGEDNEYYLKKNIYNQTRSCGFPY